MSVEVANCEAILDEIRKSKVELKNCIEASEARVLLEVSALKNKIKCLEEENEELKARLDHLERRSCKYSLVVFGMNRRLPSVSTKSVAAVLSELLGLHLIDNDFRDAYLLGSGANCPIKVELLYQRKRAEILGNARKLKGTGVSVSQDLTHNQLCQLRALREHLSRLRKTSTAKSYIRGNKLYLDGAAYTLQDLENLDTETAVGHKASNSAPSTPVGKVDDNRSRHCEASGNTARRVTPTNLRGNQDDTSTSTIATPPAGSIPGTAAGSRIADVSKGGAYKSAETSKDNNTYSRPRRRGGRQ